MYIHAGIYWVGSGVCSSFLPIPSSAQVVSTILNYVMQSAIPLFGLHVHSNRCWFHS